MTGLTSYIPVWQVVFGLVGGFIAGLVLGCTRVFRTRLYRLVGIYSGGMVFVACPFSI